MDKRILLIVVIAVILVGCTQPQQQSQEEPMATATPTTTSTPTPTLMPAVAGQYDPRLPLSDFKEGYNLRVPQELLMRLTVV